MWLREMVSVCGAQERYSMDGVYEEGEKGGVNRVRGVEGKNNNRITTTNRKRRRRKRKRRR